MAFVPVKCTSCGADIQLDEEREHGFCAYCGTRVVFQEAVQKKELELSGNVSVDGIDTVDKMWQRSEVLLKLDDYASAERNLLKITEAHPEDHRAWWMLAKLFAENKMIERVDHHIKDIVSADPSVDDCLWISRNVIEGEIITPLNYYMRNALRVVPEDSSGALRKDCQQLIKWVDDTLRDRWKVHKQKLTQSLDSYESRERTGRQEEKKSAVVSLGYRFLTVLVIAVIGFFFLLVPVTLLKGFWSVLPLWCM